MNEKEMIVPPLFKCPISLDLFKDPVTLCTGQTYDRSSIEMWLAAGNLTCPVTMQKLDDLSIVPNHTLRHLIDQWLQDGIRFRADYYEMINHDASIAALKQKLDSEESTLEEKLEIVEKIRVLSQELPLKNSCLIENDFLQLFLEKIFSHVSGSSYTENDFRFSEQALGCVLKLLPFSDLRSLNMLKEESNFANFFQLFDQGNLNIKGYLCHMVVVISSSLETQELCGLLGKSTNFLQEIFRLLHEEGSEAGIKAISALSCLESNRENLVREGAFEGLIAYIMDPRNRESNLVPTAIATIERLSVVEGAKEAVISNPNGVKAIVKMVFRVSDHQGSESAVNSLLALCSDSSQATEDAIAAGVLTQLLLLLQSQCSGRTKAKARMLLKLLKSTWHEHPKQSSKQLAQLEKN